MVLRNGAEGLDGTLVGLGFYDANIPLVYFCSWVEFVSSLVRWREQRQDETSQKSLEEIRSLFTVCGILMPRGGEEILELESQKSYILVGSHDVISQSLRVPTGPIP